MTHGGGTQYFRLDVAKGTPGKTKLVLRKMGTKLRHIGS
jgi:hypothetical protein